MIHKKINLIDELCKATYELGKLHKDKYTNDETFLILMKRFYHWCFFKFPESRWEREIRYSILEEFQGIIYEEFQIVICLNNPIFTRITHWQMDIKSCLEKNTIIVPDHQYPMDRLLNIIGDVSQKSYELGLTDHDYKEPIELLNKEANIELFERILFSMEKTIDSSNICFY